MTVISSGPFIQTHSGKLFHYQRPDVSAVDLDDVAHALGNICRFGGHTKRFYSVAEHSIHVMRWLEHRFPLVTQSALGRTLMLKALFHDASEAYAVDVPKPLKTMIADTYGPIEERIQECIETALKIPPGDAIMDELVKQADLVMLSTEMMELLPYQIGGVGEELPAPWVDCGIQCWEPGKAKSRFLREAVDLLDSEW